MARALRLSLLPRRLPFLIAAIIVLILAIAYHPQRYGIWGDQMTYYLQANSLAFDGDLQFDQRDFARFQLHGWAEKGPYGLFLREKDGRFYYSKPFLYSLAAVPFVWIAPVRGPVVLNALLWLVLLEVTFQWLRRFNSSARAGTIAALAWIGSAVPFYLFVIQTDLMIPTLLALALYLWLTSEGGPVNHLSYSIPRILLCGVFFGLAVYEKLPLVFFLGAATGSLLWQRQWRVVGVMLAAAAVCFALPSAVHVAQDGHLSPYNGNRISCNAAFSFDNLDKARAQATQFKSGGPEFFQPRFGRGFLAPERLRRFVVDLPVKLHCFLIGRKAGLFPYLTPALIALAVWLILRPWRKEERASLWIAAALAAYFLFNFFAFRIYYGGSTCIGNRYAVQVFPVFLLLVRRLPRSRGGYATLVAALVAGAAFFPGLDLASPYGKMRDNFDLFLKPKFQFLPFEWHLAFFVPDKPSAGIDRGRAGRIVWLTEMNPTHDEKGCFITAPFHQVAVLSYGPLKTFPIRLAGRLEPKLGWVGSAGARLPFSLAAYETRRFDVPLVLRDRADYSSFSIYCYSVEVTTTSPLEGSPPYALDYYARRRIGPFFQWPIGRQDSLTSATVIPDDPRYANHLLWGWQAPEPPGPEGPYGKRWAGEALESAVILPATVQHDAVLRIEADCHVGEETEVVWNGRVIEKWLVGPGEARFEHKIPANEIREGENVLALRHRWLWQPSAILGPPAKGDDRWLTVHYRKFELR